MDKDLRKRDGNTRNNDLRNFINLLQPVFGVKIMSDLETFNKLIFKSAEYKKLMKDMRIKNKQNTIVIFKFVYPEIWLKAAGHPDVLAKYAEKKYMLPFKFRHYMATHLYDKNAIKNLLKML